MRAAALALLLVAFALRARVLRGQNLGFDGGLAVALAASPLSELLDLSARDVHPPLYYLLLSGWWQVAGAGIAAALWPSLAFGLASVALMWRLNRYAAVLLALSPLQVFDGMAARDFGALVAVSLGATVVLLRAAGGSGRPAVAPPAVREGRRWWAALGGLYAAGLLTSYYFLATLLAHGAWVAWRGREVRAWLRAAAPGAVLTAAWIGLSALRIAGTVAGGARPTQTEAPGLAALISGLLQAVVGGSALANAGGAAGAWAIVAAWGAVLVFLPVARRRSGGAEPAEQTRDLWLVGLLGFELALVGTVLVVALWLRDVAPARYALVILPWAALLAGLGVVTATRAARVLGPFYAVFAAAPLVVGLWAGWRPAELPRSFWDPSGLVSWLDGAAVPSDRVVFISLEQAGYYAALSRAPLTWRVVPIGPRYLEGDLPAEAARQVDPLVVKPGRVHLVLYQGGIAPEHHVLRSRLATLAFPAGGAQLADSNVLTYLVPDAGQHMLGGGERYEGVTLDRVDQAGLARPGGLVGVSLTWRATGRLPKPYSVFVQLFDGRDEKVAQHDGTPADGARPTDQWRPGDVIVDRHGLVVPAAAQPPFALVIGLYDAIGRLKTVDGADAIRIGLD